MKMRGKLFFTLFAFGSFIMFISSLSMLELSMHTDRIKSITFYTVILCIIAGFSYLISITYCRRLEQLAEQAHEVSRHHSLKQVDPTGTHDEIYSLATSFNKIKTDLTHGEELRNQLVADVAHELRTPVAILRGHLETIIKGAMELDRNHLIPLLDETKRMSRLIQDMQDLNLAEAGRLTLDRTWVPFGPTIEEIVAILEVEAETKEINLQLEGKGGGEIYCDVPRMKQVLINLLGNAIRYTPVGGSVVIDYTYGDGQVVISIKDNGPGIAPESLPYIFKRFYRVEESRNRMLGGTGLGLAIAKQFVEIHNGTLHVHSEVGVGTVFTIMLPIFPSNP
jgi:two-component system sensor histidine kinase BaeS